MNPKTYSENFIQLDMYLENFVQLAMLVILKATFWGRNVFQQIIQIHVKHFGIPMFF